MISTRKHEDPWINISDLMSGLMIVFLLISVSYMENVKKSNINLKKQADDVKRIVVAYETTQVDLYNKLMEEFKDDLPKWGASIEKKTLSVTFLEPEILFKAGESEISNKFKEILDSFFPRYINILYSSEFRNNIDEIRIEGHTSSEWAQNLKNQSEVYFLNMELSQKRTLSVLNYCYNLIFNKEKQEFIKKYVTANGLSSSKLVLDTENNEDKKKSRRVEFRTRTNAEKEILKILEQLNEF